MGEEPNMGGITSSSFPAIARAYVHGPNSHPPSESNTTLQQTASQATWSWGREQCWKIQTVSPPSQENYRKTRSLTISIMYAACLAKIFINSSSNFLFQLSTQWHLHKHKPLEERSKLWLSLTVACRCESCLWLFYEYFPLCKPTCVSINKWTSGWRGHRRKQTSTGSSKDQSRKLHSQNKWIKRSVVLSIAYVS